MLYFIITQNDGRASSTALNTLLVKWAPHTEDSKFDRPPSPEDVLPAVGGVAGHLEAGAEQDVHAERVGRRQPHQLGGLHHVGAGRPLVRALLHDARRLHQLAEHAAAPVLQACTAHAHSDVIAVLHGRTPYATR